MTPDQANQERRDAAVKRGRRIDALEAGQLANFLHRVAAIEPAVVDRVLAEFDANAPKPRAEKQLHPVTFYAADPENRDLPDGGGLLAYCRLCPDWHDRISDGMGVEVLERAAREHSGIPA